MVLVAGGNSKVLQQLSLQANISQKLNYIGMNVMALVKKNSRSRGTWIDFQEGILWNTN